MFNQFDFDVVQLRYIKQAMVGIPTFRPDGLVPVDVQALIDAGWAGRTAFEAETATRNLADGEFHEAIDALHEACVAVYPIMQSRFRKDPGSL